MLKLSCILKNRISGLTSFLSITSLLLGTGSIYSTYAFDEVNNLSSVGEFRTGPLLLGTAVSKYGLQSTTSQQYIDTIKKNFTVIVAENEMKFHSLHRESRYKYDFTEADKIMDFAVANKLKVRGHNLIWNDVPKWVTDGNYSMIPGPLASISTAT